ncbi:MAG: sulfite exporter TauE/SafE family protein [Lactobacillales bacterium]|nr:sulfite exporter TauE/SafE family protein [Lactobacillales bacterium]
MVQILLGFLSISLVYYLFFFVRDLIKNREFLKEGKIVTAGFIGFITDFLDTLGIGSFAPTVVLLNLTKSLKDDRLLPGTLNVAHTIPIFVEAIILVTAVEVASFTLFSLVISAMVGSMIGARIVRKLSSQKVQWIMGASLLITAIFMILRRLEMLDILGQGNQATEITGGKLLIAIVVNFILGALMSTGVGLYAPCMAMIYMLGVNPMIAFPIMMASCAGLMPVASVEFIKVGDYSRVTSLGIAIGGAIGAFIAATLVKNMPLEVLTWIIIAVVLYTSITYLRKGMIRKGRQFS